MDTLNCIKFLRNVYMVQSFTQFVFLVSFSFNIEIRVRRFLIFFHLLLISSTGERERGANFVYGRKFHLNILNFFLIFSMGTVKEERTNFPLLHEERGSVPSTVHVHFGTSSSFPPSFLSCFIFTVQWYWGKRWHFQLGSVCICTFCPQKSRFFRKSYKPSQLCSSSPLTLARY